MIKAQVYRPDNFRLIFSCRYKSVGMILKMLFVFIVLLFIGNYAELSVDYPGYVNYFKCAQDSYCVGLMDNVEASFIYGAELFGFVFGPDSAPLFLFCIAATSFLIKIKVVEETGNFWVPVFCYLAFQFFHHEMTQIRIGLGIAFFWMGIARKRNKNSSFLFFLISALSHYSMIIGMVFFVFFSSIRFKLSSVTKLCLVILFYIFASFFGYFSVYFIDLLADVLLFERVNVYVAAVGSDYYSSPQFSVQLIVTALLSLIPFFLPRNDLNDVLHNITISGVLIYLGFYWIPVLPLRVFELLTSVIPIYFAFSLTGARFWKVRLIVLALCAVVLMNWHVRNNMFSEDNEKVVSSIEGLSS